MHKNKMANKLIVKKFQTQEAIKAPSFLNQIAMQKNQKYIYIFLYLF